MVAISSSCQLVSNSNSGSEKGFESCAGTSHIETPLIFSESFSKDLGADVFLIPGREELLCVFNPTHGEVLLSYVI